MEIFVKEKGTDEPFQKIGNCVDLRTKEEYTPTSRGFGVSYTAICQTSSFIREKELIKAFTRPKFPRKMKKALTQMWKKERCGDKLNVSFTLKRRTRWQRKVANMVKYRDGLIYIPMKNGHKLIIDYREN